LKDSSKIKRRLSIKSRPKPVPVQGEIYFVDLPKQAIQIKNKKVDGREMYGPHRCLVLQSSDVTQQLDYIIVMPISSAKEKVERPSWMEIPAKTIPGIPVRSYVVCEQIRCIDKRRVKQYVGKLSQASMLLVQKIFESLCPSAVDFTDEVVPEEPLT
jgi:mRNA interferase MazF